MIHIRNQTTQLHRVYLPVSAGARTFVDVSPHSDQTIPGDVRAAYAAVARFGVHLIRKGDPVPENAGLVFFDDTGPIPGAEIISAHFDEAPTPVVPKRKSRRPVLED